LARKLPNFSRVRFSVTKDEMNSMIIENTSLHNGSRAPRTSRANRIVLLYNLPLQARSLATLGEGEESIQHVLLHCPRWTATRAKLQAAVGDSWEDVSYLVETQVESGGI
jgi:hypothetical protein